MRYNPHLVLFMTEKDSQAFVKLLQHFYPNIQYRHFAISEYSSDMQSLLGVCYENTVNKFKFGVTIIGFELDTTFLVNNYMESVKRFNTFMFSQIEDILTLLNNFDNPLPYVLLKKNTTRLSVYYSLSKKTSRFAL